MMVPLDKGELRVLSMFNTLRGNAAAFLGAVAAALLAIHPIGAAPWRPDWLSFIGGRIYFGLALALYLAAIVVFIVRKESVGALRAKVRALEEKNTQVSLNLIAVLFEQIKQLLVQLDLNTPDHRISLYRHYEGKFRLLVRYSRNPMYQHTGRSTYSDNQGLIGDCWRNAKMHVKNLPADEAKWVEVAVEKSGFSTEDAQKIRMKARSMMGVRLDCGETRSVPTGVIIIESMDPKGMADQVDDLIRNEMVDLITRTLQVSIQSLPADGREAIRQITSPTAAISADGDVSPRLHGSTARQAKRLTGRLGVFKASAPPARSDQA